MSNNYCHFSFNLKVHPNIARPKMCTCNCYPALLLKVARAGTETKGYILLIIDMYEYVLYIPGVTGSISGGC